MGASLPTGAQVKINAGKIAPVGLLGAVQLSPSPTVVPPVFAPTLSLNQAPAPSVLTVAESRGAKDDGEPAATALSGLFRHGVESAQIAKIKGGADAKDGAELNFMRSAGLETPFSGAGNASVAMGLRGDSPSLVQKGAAGGSGKRTITLDNGMKVQLESQPSSFRATIVVAYDVGGRDEDEGETGFSHFVEHLMYQGTTRVKNWFRMVGTMGAFTNATTDRDQTIYTQIFPFNMLETALSLEAERMVNLDVTPEKVEREKRVILEEKAAHDSNPHVKAAEKLNELLFSKKRNHSTVIGSEENIRGATAAKLKRYIETYYTPDRAHMVIKGRLDLDETEAWVRRYFGDIPARKSDAVKPDLSEAGLKEEARAEILAGATANPAILFSWLAPKYQTSDYYAVGVLALLLSQRLQQKLVVSEKSAIGASLAAPYLEREAGAITGSISLGSGLTPDAALAALDEEIARVVRGEIDAAELAAMIRIMVEERWKNMGAADQMAVTAARGLTAADIEADIQRWAKVSAADLKRVARTVLGKSRRAVVTVRPDARNTAAVVEFKHEYISRVDETPTSEEQALLEELARTEWPEVNDKKAPSEFTLDNGLKVIVQPDGGPTVHARLAFRLGDTAADAEMRGRVPFVAQVLGRKTAEKDELTMHNVLQSARAALGIQQVWDHMVFSGEAPLEGAGSLLALMAEIVTRPNGWTDAELAPFKTWWKEVLRGSDASAGVATYRRAVLDQLGDHPATRYPTPEAIDALSAEEFAKLVAGHFTANNAVLVIAGDVDPARMKDALTLLFGGWKSSAKAAAGVPAVDIKPQKIISLLDSPGAKQSMIRLSAIAVGASAQNSADHFPMLVVDSILGDGLASRLTSVLRQSMGLAYTTFSEVTTDPTVAMLSLGLLTRTSHTGRALDVLLEQVRRLREEPVGEIELGAAKNALISSFLMGLDVIGNIADNLLGLELFHQPLSDFGLYPKRVAAVTSDDVLQSAAKLLDSRRLAITVAGDAAAVRDDLSRVRPVVEYAPEPIKERPSF